MVHTDGWLHGRTNGEHVDTTGYDGTTGYTGLRYCLAERTMTAIVEIRGLRKVYSKPRRDSVVAVSGLDLTLGTPGTVHGFLGPNGSGKTTTIRCLLGLVRPTAGSTQVFGANSVGELHNVIHRVGAIVENPKLFPRFSGRRNLALLAKLGGVEVANVDRVLETVGLADRHKDTFESYSLGMKQRLAIGAALLKDPDLLILDEPANGLDPAGIAEMRVLIRSIADQGKAILVSSHQLAEIEQVCDEVTIISNGELVQSGSLDQVRSSAGSERVIVTIAERDQALATLAAANIGAKPQPNATEILVDIAGAESALVTKTLAQAGLYLQGLRTERASLESAFLNLTGGPPPPPPGVSAAPPPSPGAAPPPQPGGPRPPAAPGEVAQ